MGPIPIGVIDADASRAQIATNHPTVTDVSERVGLRQSPRDATQGHCGYSHSMVPGGLEVMS